ncbi:phage major capsid protein [Streptomyces polyrhachis]|uniref:Phage major capsid protein n=1 Tax=Streptomyces polyrhachis TaxID=1282885 RepID=A0ABW2GM66_9ACTN
MMYNHRETSEIRSWLTGDGTRALELKPSPEEARTLSKISAGAGGATVPTSFYSRLIQHLTAKSGVLDAGPTVLHTSSGEQMTIPKTTAHSANAGIVAEAGILPANDPAFGMATLDAWKYGYLIQLSHELVNDSAVDILGYLAQSAGRALGDGLGIHLVSGTGSGQPMGVLTASTTGKTGATGAQGMPSGDDLIDLYHSVSNPYRDHAVWLMSDTTYAKLRKLRDGSGGAGNGNYLWSPGLTAADPGLLLGKRVVIDPNMPSVGVGAKSILFGDFRSYFVRFAEGVRFERSDDYAFNQDLITFRCLLRADGEQVDASGAIKHFQGGAS